MALRVGHLHLENWRNFTQVEVDLQRRVFLVGPNASGKSNFLDVFRFLHDIVAVGGGFQEAVRKRGGVSPLRCLAARRYSDIVIRVHIGDDGNSSTWTYELRFNQDNTQRPVVKEERVEREGTGILARPNKEDEQDPERLTQTFLEQVNVNREFREVAAFLSTRSCSWCRAPRGRPSIRPASLARSSLLKGGVSLAEAVIPRTRPAGWTSL